MEPGGKRSGAFQWNLGAWLGGQLGGTCWILILGILLLAKDPFTGVVALVCFAAPNLVGWALWRRRDRLAPYPALQALVAVEAVFALVVVATLHVRSAMDLLPPGSQVSIRTMYGCLLVFPAIMFQFWWFERQTRRAHARGDQAMN